MFYYILRITAHLRASDDGCLGLERGCGVVATQNFYKGQFICEYQGQIVGNNEAKTRESTYSMDITKGSYM